MESPLVATGVTQARIPGDFYLNVAPVRTGDGIVNMYVAFDRVSRIAFAELHSGASSEQAAKFLSNLVDAVPYRVYGTLTNDSQIFIGRPYRQVRIRHNINHQFCRLRIRGIFARLPAQNSSEKAASASRTTTT